MTKNKINTFYKNENEKNIKLQGQKNIYKCISSPHTHTHTIYNDRSCGSET